MRGASIATPHRMPTLFENRLVLALAALGVVYGDLGTNVLFALRECFKPDPDGLAPTPANVLSVLSLIFWALMLVVVVKYLSIVLRADNHGEGGILALLALILGQPEDEAAVGPSRWPSRRTVLTLLGLFGTAFAPGRRHDHAVDLRPERGRGPRRGCAELHLRSFLSPCSS